MLDRLWQLSYDSPTIDVLRNSKYAIPLIQSVHLFGITLILAAAVILNFRLLGWGLTALPFRTLAQESWRWSRVGLLLAVASGFVVFLPDPARYAANSAFLTKMCLLAAACILHFTLIRRAVRSQNEQGRKVLAVLSLTLWFAVGWAGRAIAFLG